MTKLNFEKSMKQLEQIVQQLESGDLSLEKAIKKFEDGVGLSKLCSKQLDETEKKVTMLLRDQDGKISVNLFKPDEETET
ncbi:MAG: exodeoxyribonuclease VII small subunit [Deltaproteobacteria bacterium]|nr:exodeoxyribonuclease VII small subunit [Deltaproteobacteria bacterium]MBW2660919.1 exodeoxyribonuclease VII small subunit [Deltaproteobacteria bacterium]